jgi:hypothetical protein
MFERLRTIFGMPGSERAPATITLNQARAIVRELGFTLRHDVDRAEYRLRPVGAADAQAYYARDLADAVKAARQWDGVAKWHPERQRWE